MRAVEVGDRLVDEILVPVLELVDALDRAVVVGVEMSITSSIDAPGQDALGDAPHRVLDPVQLFPSPRVRLVEIEIDAGEVARRTTRSGRARPGCGDRPPGRTRRGGTRRARRSPRWRARPRPRAWCRRDAARRACGRTDRCRARRPRSPPAPRTRAPGAAPRRALARLRRAATPRCSRATSGTRVMRSVAMAQSSSVSRRMRSKHWRATGSGCAMIRTSRSRSPASY